VISQAASVIKASVPMAGARTRLGAMTPLVGPAPTSFNFGNNDYNRKTGLVGDGSAKYLDSNRNNNADPQNSVSPVNIDSTSTSTSVASNSLNIPVFARRTAVSTLDGYSNARLAFYSIGESLDLAILDARVTALINAYAAAIP
jgi:hypothetical protein